MSMPEWAKLSSFVASSRHGQSQGSIETRCAQKCYYNSASRKERDSLDRKAVLVLSGFRRPEVPPASVALVALEQRALFVDEPFTANGSKKRTDFALGHGDPVVQELSSRPAIGRRERFVGSYTHSG